MAASYVGGSSAGDGSTASSLTLTIPAGAQAGHVAIMVAESLNTTVDLSSVPSGWTLPNGAADRNGGNGSSWLLHKTLTSADITAGSVTLSFNTAQRCLAMLNAWSGVTLTGALLATLLDTASNTDLPVPSIASVPAGAEFLVVFAYRSNGAMPDAGLLTGYEQGARTASSGAGPYLSVESQHKTVSAAGTYGGETATAPAACTGVAYAMALPADTATPPPAATVTRVQRGRNAAYGSGAGNLTSLAATLPSPATAGSLLLAGYIVDKDSGTFTVPTGWTLVPGFTGTTTGLQQASLHAIYKIAAGGETTVTGSWASAQDGASAHIVEYSGVSTSDPFGPVTVPAYSDTGVGSFVLNPGAAEAAGLCVVLLGIDSEDVGPRFTPSGTGFTLVDSVSAADFDGTATGGRPPLALLESGALTSGQDLASTTFSWSPQVDQAVGAAILLNAGSAPTGPSPALGSRRVGIPSGTAIPFGCTTTDASSVRVKVATDAAMTTGTAYSPAVTPNAQGDSLMTVTGLSAPAYYYQFAMTPTGGGAEVLGPVEGPITMAPSGATSYAFCFGSCDDAQDSPAWAAIAARNDPFFLHLGDWPSDTAASNYADGSGTDLANFRTQFRRPFSEPNHAAVFERPFDYTCSDHCALQNNTTAGNAATAWANWNTMLRELIPALDRPAGSGCYGQFHWGRIRYFRLDTRSFASSPGAADNASKTKLGAAQLAWLDAAMEAATEPVFIVLQDGPFVSAAVAGDDNWPGYTTHRVDVTAVFNKHRARGKVVGMLAGDMHAVAGDDGTHSDAYGLDFIFHGAPLQNSASVKGGPYSDGPYPASGTAEVQQYGRVVVDDTGGSTIDVTFTGYSADNTQRVSVPLSFDVTAPPAAQPMYVGATQVDAAYIGSTPVDAIYVGSVQIYPFDPAPATGVLAAPADSFVDTMGVCVHLAYGGGPYTDDWTTGANTRQKILDLGIRHLRDFAYVGGSNGVEGSTFYQRVRDLVANGVRFNLSTQAYADVSGKPVTDWSQLEAVYTTWTDRGVVTFEAHNEPENVNAAAANAGMVSLWNAWQASAELQANTKIVGYPLIWSSDQWDAFVGGTGIDGARSGWDFDPADYCHYGNWHPYPGAVKPTLVSGTTDHLAASHTDAKMFGVADWDGTDYGSNGFMITECDYNTALAHGPASHYPISEAGQARYVLREFAEYFRMGYDRVFAYELMDQGTANNTDPEMNFGWVRRDGTVKPAYTAVKNLITLLADPGAAFTPGRLDYTITGGDADVRHLLFGKRDGTFWVAIWQDKSVWNRDTQTDLSPADQTVTLTVPAGKTVTSYLPRTGTGGTSVTVSGDSATISVPAEVKLLRIT